MALIRRGILSKLVGPIIRGANEVFSHLLCSHFVYGSICCWGKGAVSVLLQGLSPLARGEHSVTTCGHLHGDVILNLHGRWKGGCASPPPPSVLFHLSLNQHHQSEICGRFGGFYAQFPHRLWRSLAEKPLHQALNHAVASVPGKTNYFFSTLFNAHYLFALLIDGWILMKRPAMICVCLSDGFIGAHVLSLPPPKFHIKG